MIFSLNDVKRVLAGMLFLFAFTSHYCFADLSNTPDKAVSEHEFIRCLPDLKVLLRPGQTMTTTFDLKDAYAALSDSIDSIEIADGAENKVVDAKIDGHLLKLRWKDVGSRQLTLRITDAKAGLEYFDKIQIEAWEANYTAVFFSVLGGLGVFLLGMKFMSDSLQIVAGSSLRNLISTVTENRFAAVFVGFVIQ